MNDLLITAAALLAAAALLLGRRVRDTWVDWRARRRGPDAELAHLRAERERLREELRRRGEEP